MLSKFASLIFVTVGARLVNDEDATCKRAAARCIKEMLERLEHNLRSKLFDIVVTWLEDKKLMHRRLAVQLCGSFASCEKQGFESRLAGLLPLLGKQFYLTEEFVGGDADEATAGRFVRVQKQRSDDLVTMDEGVKDPERLRDHHLFQVQQLLLKLSANCSAFLQDRKYRDHVDTYAGTFFLYLLCLCYDRLERCS